ncbi:MAG: molybdopterin synthase sulfur carrier subunit [Alkalinema sp. CACIAM 70d]|nr:MAG: molybdopterin synthase sulfur carrier subunit [Alkalinema sp. CACIAM 70d]
MIHITIKLFAVYQEAYGCADLHWQLPQGMTVGELFDRILAEHPQLEAWRNLTQFGVNLAFVSPETLLQDGDEVVLIPPVSGG